MRIIYMFMLIAVATTACNNSENKFDATGTFEATEVIVSSELGGRIVSLNVNEGDTISAVASVVGEDDEVE